MLTQILHLHALSALHVGAGQAIGVVDLPVARARATNLPLVPGSALKGVLRDEFAGHAHQKTLFGPQSIGEGSVAHAGALAFGDAHLLLLPVRSLAGIAAFVTCPFVLARYAEDLRRAGRPADELPAVEAVAEQTARLTTDTCLQARDDWLVLEDLDLGSAGGADPWARWIAARLHADQPKWQKMFTQRFAILCDDDFSFLADTATEVRARIRVNDQTGVVQDGGLWYEENLPAETVLWGVLAAGPARDASALPQEEVMRIFRQRLGGQSTLQIGGKATIGRGLVRLILSAEQRP